MNKKTILACLALSGLLLAGCGGDDKKPSEPGGSSGAPTSSSQPVVNKYTVTWTHPDTGVLRVDENVAEGTTPVYGAANPTKASTAEYVYEFSGWTPTPGPISGNTTYTATFNQQPRQYSVKFYDDAEHLIHEDSLAYGSMPSYPVNPSKEGTAEYTYNFDHWDKELEEVHSDQTYIAHFSASKNHYDVYFLSEDGLTELDKDETVEYGVAPVYDAAEPTKDKTATITYTFDGWTSDGGEHVYATGNLPVVSGETIYRAHFAESKTKYTVRFLNWNGNLLESYENIDYDDTNAINLFEGSEPTCSENPTYIYDFIGFKEEPLDVGNFYRNFVAQFEPINSKEEAFSYTLDGEEYIVNGWASSNADECWIPAEHEGKPVTKIRDNASFNGIERLHIPASITYIGQGAFSYGNIKSVDIAGNPVIANNAFYNNNLLKDLTIAGNGAYTIGSNAFQNCLLDGNVSIGTGCTEIGGSAFASTKIKSFPLMENLESIGQYAFQRCRELESITFGEKLTSIGYYSFSECDKLSEIVIPDSVTAISNYAFYKCPLLGSVTLGKGLTTFKYQWFFDSGISEYHVSEGHEFLSAADGVLYSVDGTELISYPASKGGEFVMPSKVTSVSMYAFTCCKNIESIEFSTNCSMVSNYCFYQAEIKEVTLPDGVTRIGDSAFRESTIETINVGSGLSEIGTGAFIDAESLAELNFVNNENFAFEEDVLYGLTTGVRTSIALVLTSKEGTYTTPDSVTSVASCAFYGTNLSSITLSDHVATIGQNCFQGCSAETINLSNILTVIPAWCFKDTVATSIVLPDTVEVIYQEAFENSKITSFAAPTALKTISYRTFKDCADLATIDLGSVQSLMDHALSNIPGITSLTIPSTVTQMIEGTISYCENLKTLDLSKMTGLNAIPNRLAQGCAKLETVTMSNNITSIGNDAFESCSALTSINLSTSLTSIGNEAFYRCNSLASITLPATLTSIGRYAFSFTAINTFVYSGTTSQWLDSTFKSNRHADWANWPTEADKMYLTTIDDGNLDLYYEANR